MDQFCSIRINCKEEAIKHHKQFSKSPHNEMTIKALPILVLLALFNFSSSSTATFTGTTRSKPQIIKSFQIKSNLNKNVGSCSYSVVVKTSCSSPSYTRDQVSLAFGDSSGNEVYAPRLDDLRSRTFERCSTDTFQINGPCAYDICYLYLLRSGRDGWKPESVQVYRTNRQPVTFYYNTLLPNGVWFGFNQCRGHRTVSAAAHIMWNTTR